MLNPLPAPAHGRYFVFFPVDEVRPESFPSGAGAFGFGGAVLADLGFAAVCAEAAGLDALSPLVGLPEGSLLMKCPQLMQ